MGLCGNHWLAAASGGGDPHSPGQLVSRRMGLCQAPIQRAGHARRNTMGNTVPWRRGSQLPRPHCCYTLAPLPGAAASCPIPGYSGGVAARPARVNGVPRSPAGPAQRGWHIRRGYRSGLCCEMPGLRSLPARTPRAGCARWDLRNVIVGPGRDGVQHLPGQPSPDTRLPPPSLGRHMPSHCG